MSWKAARIAVAAATVATAAATAADAASVLMSGCASLTVDADSGHAEGVEVMPMAQTVGTSVFYSFADAAECQAKCASVDDCHFFTFRESKATGERVCLLRPAPSLATSPLFQLRTFDSSSLFSYTSGYKNNSQDCNDGAELVAGCEGSAPGSCALLGKHVSFNETCITDPALNAHCGVQGFACCVDCDAAGDEACCGRNHRLAGYVLAGGVNLDGSAAAGVRHAEECWARCYAANSCTHWNFITTESTGAVAGSCYLKHYENPSAPGYIKAPAFIDSVVGGVDCSQDYGLVAPINDGDSTTEDSPDDVTGTTDPPYTTFGGKPIENTCFESGVDLSGANVFQQWGIGSGEACQTECQKWPGCKGFVYDPAHAGCYMKYSFVGKVLANEGDTSERFVTGPRDCPNVTPAELPDGAANCVFTDHDIQLEDLTATPAGHAFECWQKCTFWEGCKGWSFFEEQCYLKLGTTPLVAAPGVLSGSSECTWPVQRRKLGMPISVERKDAEARSNFVYATAPGRGGGGFVYATAVRGRSDGASAVSDDESDLDELRRKIFEALKTKSPDADVLIELYEQRIKAGTTHGTSMTTHADFKKDAEAAPASAEETVILDRQVAATIAPTTIPLATVLADISTNHFAKRLAETLMPTRMNSAPAKNEIAVLAPSGIPLIPTGAEAFVPTAASGTVSNTPGKGVPEIPMDHECVIKNKDVRGPALETLGAVKTEEECRQKCAEREDCFIAAYTPAEQLCKFRYHGKSYDKLGTDLLRRQCVLDDKRIAKTAVAAEPGMSYHFLGKPTQWSLKGELPDFATPRSWSRMALLLMTADERDCFVSDVLANVQNCWDQHHLYLPLDVQLQVIGVALGAKFPGWSNIDWEPAAGDTSQENGLVELFNKRVTITAEGKTLTDGHGVWISGITDNLSAAWPEDMTSPVNFRQGSFYARLRVFGKRTEAARIVFCITGSDAPLAEICSFPLTLPTTVNDGEVLQIM